MTDEKNIKRAQRAKVQKLTKMLRAAPDGKAGEGVLSPPAMLMAPDFKPALAVWQDVAPLIDQRALLKPDDRYVLAIFCCNFATWTKAQIDIAENGEYFMVPSTAGPDRPWDNPMLAVAKEATKVVMDLSARFGLTALDRAKLYKAQKEDPLAPLFDPVRRGVNQDAPQEDAPPASEGDSWGHLLDAPPEGQLN